MRTWMFPGQGSQALGMGQGLFEDFPALTAQADAILGYSVKELCLADPRRQLDDTRFTQPALFVVNALACMKRMGEGGTPPDYLIGHSLGELNALFAAGCFTFERGLALVQMRAQLMGRVTGGAMAAILNAVPESVTALLQDQGLSRVELANYNTPSQVVISGPMEDLAAAQRVLEKGGMTVIKLNASGPFHSRLMAEAQQEFARFLQGSTLSAPRIPVIANVSARSYPSEAIAETLSRQIASPVRWSESIEYLLGMGPAAERMEFEELGHGNMLTRLVGSIRKHLEAARTAAAPCPVRQLPNVQERAAGVTAVGSPFEKAAAWNQRHTVGVAVCAGALGNRAARTRTPAMLLQDRKAIVYLQGYAGYFDLDDIAPVP